ncbi:MAG: pyruvate dehydrogenase E2 component (dihydrolipoamide acetyltransferase) [Psychromonas sp.]|jgi:pyruvate dehydrogenase E2 component (dihydrolipoamide acetyltransferase)|uniref:dihydrolipoamide acetyltransferase family protein n=1 Tax=Psychromonas sp. TaxID=1884585 RepID=UPI0039E61EFC
MSENVHDLNMPSFGADMATGTLVEWLVKQGDSIKRGAVIAVIDTHKGAIDLDLFEDAIIEKLLVEEGEQVTVGTPIARLRSLSSPSAATDTPTNESPLTEKEIIESDNALEVKEETDDKVIQNSANFILATPAARAYALKHRLSLVNLSAANNNQIVTLTIAEAALTQTDDSPSTRTTASEKKATAQHSKSGFDKNAMREAISDTVTRSKQQIPHYYLSQRLDISALEQYLQSHNANVPAESRILLAAPLLCAIARTLMKNKQLNGIYTNHTFVASNTVNLANAINLRGGGLVMPVIHDAQTLTAQSIMERLKEQVERARSGSLRVSELSDGSCTVTSIGERGAEQMFAVIYPPQVAIIALGSAHQEAMVIDGIVQARSIIEATLAADHRVSDGHIGARLLYQLNQQLQKPEQLWSIENPASDA